MIYIVCILKASHMSATLRFFRLQGVRASQGVLWMRHIALQSLGDAGEGEGIQLPYLTLLCTDTPRRRQYLYALHMNLVSIYRSIGLHCNLNNSPAVKLYSSMGYRATPAKVRNEGLMIILSILLIIWCNNQNSCLILTGVGHYSSPLWATT